jgi:magnesium transporter
MERTELVAAAETLDADELADLAPDLPQEVIDDVFRSLSVEEREQLRAAMSYPEDTVGSIMDFDMVTVREDVTLEVVLRYLRRFDELPDHTDQLFVVDREEYLKGVLPLNILLVNDPEVEVGALMQTDRQLRAGRRPRRRPRPSSATTWCRRRWSIRRQAGRPGDGERGGRLHPRGSRTGATGARRPAREEDIFASVWDSVKNRWAWLAVNLVTAFIASRVIGAFEDSIEKLVALAALMPIVAGIGGNSGNQTITMIVRAIAMGQVEPDAMRACCARSLAWPASTACSGAACSALPPGGSTAAWRSAW